MNDLIRAALGRAYSDIHSAIPRAEVVAGLRDLFAEATIHNAAAVYQNSLRERVAARTKGDVCGDYIGRVQLDLLDEVLNG